MTETPMNSEKTVAAEQTTAPTEPRSWRHYYLRSLLFMVPLTLLPVLAVQWLNSGWGWGIFVLTPFAGGLLGGLYWGRQGYGFRAALGNLAAAVVPTLGLMLIARIEGLACTFLALPLLLPMWVVGGALGAAWGQALRRSKSTAKKVMSALVCLPFLAVGSDAATFAPAAREVTTVIEVDAPPAVVWNRVICFPELPGYDNDSRPSTYFLNYPQPVRCDLKGTGVGAMRYCIFTQGQFDERVTVWEPGRQLTFEVDAQPKRINGYLKIGKGQFLLEALPGGKTRITGTTWFQSLLSPTWYFDLWCEQMLHDIHGDVLKHVKQLAEADARGSAAR